MSGTENENHTLITLRGPAPVINIKTCRIHDLTWDSNNSALEFKAQIPAERTAKTKQSDKNNPIH
jgi:hypothetical protein